MPRTLLIPTEWSGFFVRVHIDLTPNAVHIVIDRHNVANRADHRPKWSEKFTTDFESVEHILILWKHCEYAQLLEYLNTLPTIKQEAKKSVSPRRLARVLRRFLEIGILPDDSSPSFRVPKKRLADVATEAAYPIKRELPPMLPPEPVVNQSEPLEPFNVRAEKARKRALFLLSPPEGTAYDKKGKAPRTIIVK